MLDDDLDNYSNMELIFNYMSRVWTDELRYKIIDEFDDITINDFSLIVDFKRFVTLYKVTEPLEHISIPDTITYNVDKEYVINTIFDKLNSN